MDYFNNKPSQIAINSVKILISGVALVSVFFVVIDLTYFLSVPSKPPLIVQTKESWVNASWDLFIDMWLISLFMLQHTVLATSGIKQYLNQWGLQVVYRNLYVISTALVLEILMKYWHTNSDFYLWTINLTYRPFWWLYIGLHSVSWLLIYVGNICTDVTELIGIKQVYYNVANLPDPKYNKSAQLRQLNDHMRHPSFLAFVIIFWLCPVMSIDRLLLSSIVTLYMYVAWNTDNSDYAYQKIQYQRKYHELQQLHRYSY